MAIFQSRLPFTFRLRTHRSNRFWSCLLFTLSISALIVANSQTAARKVSSSPSASGSPIAGSCDQALRRCSKQMACGLALTEYRQACKQLLYGLSRNCSDLCQLAVSGLLSSNEGLAYFSCDCAGHHYCRLIRQRTSVCSARLVALLASSSPPPSTSHSGPGGSTANAIQIPSSGSSSTFGSSAVDQALVSTSIDHTGRSFGTSASSAASSAASSGAFAAASSATNASIGPVGTSGQSAIGPSAGPYAHSRSSKGQRGSKSHHHYHSCRSVELICRSDAHCWATFDAFRNNCADALHGDRCTSRCNSSVSLLWRQKSGQNFKHCLCERSGSSTSNSASSNSGTSNSVFAAIVGSGSSSSSRCRRQRINLLRSCQLLGMSGRVKNAVSSVSPWHCLITIFVGLFCRLLL
jgi:hypothetical protein